MILKQEKISEVTSTSDIQQFGVTEKGLVKLMGILSNLYNNPLAFIIEEISNSWDSHVQANCKDRPIVLKFDKDINGKRFLQFKDWGTGMSPQLIQDVYTKYGESTKETSNEVIGNFGLKKKYL